MIRQLVNRLFRLYIFMFWKTVRYKLNLYTSMNWNSKFVSTEILLYLCQMVKFRFLRVDRNWEVWEGIIELFLKSRIVKDGPSESDWGCEFFLACTNFFVSNAFEGLYFSVSSHLHIFFWGVGEGEGGDGEEGGGGGRQGEGGWG